MNYDTMALETFLLPCLRSPYLPSFLLLPFSAYKSMGSAVSTPAPPVAKKVPHRMELFNDVRMDNYHWLRDNSRTDSEVLSHLKAENHYTSLIMSDMKSLEDEIHAEMRAQIEENDISVPVRLGEYYYYEKTLAGKEYVQHCRCLIQSNDPPSVYDVMPREPDAPKEHVILDENVKAMEHDYYSVEAFEVSPNNKMVAYAEDTKGDEICVIHVIDAESGDPVDQPLTGNISYPIEWIGNEYLVYVTRDEIFRNEKVWLHKLGTDQSCDKCIYHEKDVSLSIQIYMSESKEFLFLASWNNETSFDFYLDVSKPENGIVPLTTNVDGVRCTIASHRGEHFFILRDSKERNNSEVVICPLNNPSELTILLPHRERVEIQDMKLFKNYIVLLEWDEHDVLKLIVYSLPPIGEQISHLVKGRNIDFQDHLMRIEESQFDSTILQFSCSSMWTPRTVYDYEMDTGVSVVKKIETVQGDFDASNYVTENKYVVASDGKRIPTSILYKKNQVNLDGSDPLLLYGYGSYMDSISTSFSKERLFFVDKGFIYAIAHVRGGGEMGLEGYEAGKLTNKKNTFTDFISCAEYLIENKYCSRNTLCIKSESAGGLLIGAVVNMRPDLFKAAILDVPFVDVLTTLLDPSLPLTVIEWPEWGDPRKEEFYDYIKSYSPVDNIEAKHYPNILVTASLNDSRVGYYEAAKYVAKLREMKTNNNLLLFKCDLSAGHFSSSGRFEQLKKEALFYVFMLKALDMIP